MKTKPIAIIPARGGSKRIPRKNIRPFCGKPIINYSIEAALSSGLFDEVMVSTDDNEIVSIAMQAGAKVPFLRSPENANDIAGTVPVLIEVLEAYKKMGFIYDTCCCIYPTAPFLNIKLLQEAYQLFEHTNCDSVFPVLRFSYPVQRALRLSDSGYMEMIWPENYLKRSQDLEPVFHDAGQFYWLDIKFLEDSGSLFGRRSRCIELSELQAQDIDNDDDWVLAELKYNFLKSGNLFR